MKLSEKTGTIELLQSRYSLTGLIGEIHEIVTGHASFPVIIAGHSWGAWLGIIFSKKYPDLVRKLILIASGPLQAHYARNIMSTRMDRISPAKRESLNVLMNKLNESETGKNDIFERIGHILDIADTYKSIQDISSDIEYNYEIYEAIWPQAANLRDSGELLSIASSIACPVVAIHGDYDPHPAEGVEKPLSEYVKDFRFILLEKCGHYPWKEQFAYRRFYKFMENEITT
jgi:pimeloyl-ACP methyl ester carboxylesterase